MFSFVGPSESTFFSQDNHDHPSRCQLWVISYILFYNINIFLILSHFSSFMLVKLLWVMKLKFLCSWKLQHLSKLWVYLDSVAFIFVIKISSLIISIHFITGLRNKSNSSEVSQMDEEKEFNQVHQREVIY